MWGSLYVQEKVTQFRLEEAERRLKQLGIDGPASEPAQAGADRAGASRPLRVRRRWLLPLHVAGHTLVRLGTRLEDLSHVPLRDSALRPEPED